MADEIRLEGRTVAVTGAGGFIGAALSRRLVAEGAAVRGIDARAEAADVVEAAGAEPVVADVTDRDPVGQALAGCEMVVHTAAIVSDAGAMAEHVRVNVGGTATVLDAARAAGVDRCLHVSSVVVYGYDDPSEQDESAHLRNVGVPYIDTKSASDRLARARGAVVVRPGDVYGPGSVPWTLRPLEMARAGQLAVVDRDALMLPVYVDDLVDGIVVALCSGEPGEAYTAWNDDDRVTFEDFFNRFAEMTGGRPARRLPMPLLRALGLVAEAASRVTGNPPPLTRHSSILISRHGTVSAARLRALGWVPRVRFDEGMRRTEAWLRDEGLL